MRKTKSSPTIEEHSSYKRSPAASPTVSSPSMPVGQNVEPNAVKQTQRTTATAITQYGLQYPQRTPAPARSPRAPRVVNSAHTPRTTTTRSASASTPRGAVALSSLRPPPVEPPNPAVLRRRGSVTAVCRGAFPIPMPQPPAAHFARLHLAASESDLSSPFQVKRIGYKPVMSAAQSRLSAPQPLDLAIPGKAHIEYIGGPILLTAPHGLKLIRGGEEGEPVRIHFQEKWVTELVLMLSVVIARQMGFQPSFVVWNLKGARKADSRNLDPNFLTKEQLTLSPWNHALRKLRDKYPNSPVLHVDIHGKADRLDNLDLDLGIRPLEELWPRKEEVQRLKAVLVSGFREVFADMPQFKNGMPFTVHPDPLMCGYWPARGKPMIKTISHQAVEIGCPAFQIEIPRTMRKELMTDERFLERFASVICKGFQHIQTNFDHGGLGPPVVPSPVNKSSRIFAQVDRLLKDFVDVDRLEADKQI